MKKNTLKFELTFNLNTSKGEILDQDSIKDFQQSLQCYIEEWNGYHGSFYAYSDGYDTDIDPTAIKVKRIK